jgi:transposase
MIRIDAVWLATQALDMRSGVDSCLARVITVFGAAHPHTAYLFANQRANRMKVLVHDGIGFWLAARRLHHGHFVWPDLAAQTQINLSRAQLDALVLGLPWSRIGEGGIITAV